MIKTNDSFLIEETKRILNILNERGGNPLARLETFGKQNRHYTILSSTREFYINEHGQKIPMTPEIQNRRFLMLKKQIRNDGYGYREVVGTYEGNHEKSLMVFAKDIGDRAGQQLVSDTKKWARMFGNDDVNAQDSIYHHDGNGGKLIGTNNTGFPGYEKSVDVGQNHYGKKIEDEPFKTEFDHRRKEQFRRKFSTIK